MNNPLLVVRNASSLRPRLFKLLLGNWKCSVHSQAHFFAARWRIITKIWHKTFKSPVISPAKKQQQPEHHMQKNK